jgi:hypothetical protein
MQIELVLLDNPYSLFLELLIQIHYHSLNYLQYLLGLVQLVLLSLLVLMVVVLLQLVVVLVLELVMQQLQLQV